MWSSRKISSDARAALPLRRGERVLASTVDGEGRPLVGTQEALYVADSPDSPDAADQATAEDRADAAGPEQPADIRRIPWEHVERAEWDRDAGVLRVRETAAFGEPVPVTTLVVPQPEPLLQLIRERVTASIVFTQTTPVAEGRSVRVVARRRPGSDDELSWSFVFDAGLDPSDPDVRSAAERALAEARGQVGS